MAILQYRQAKIEADMLEMRTKVNEMHAILLQAKGVRWIVLAVAGFTAGAASLVAHFWK